MLTKKTPVSCWGVEGRTCPRRFSSSVRTPYPPTPNYHFQIKWTLWVQPTFYPFWGWNLWRLNMFLTLKYVSYTLATWLSPEQGKRRRKIFGQYIGFHGGAHWTKQLIYNVSLGPSGRSDLTIYRFLSGCWSDLCPGICSVLSYKEQSV